MEQIPAAEVERVMRVREVILRAMSKKISWWQAAEILGISPRTMRRWKRQFDEYGARSLFDGRKGKANWRRAPAAEIEKVLALYQDQYYDFNVRHFHEKLRADHQIGWSYTWVKNVLQGAGLVKKSRTREKHRKRRPRRTLPGMMLHIDGSHHQWFQDGRWYDLIVILDDATSEIYYAQLVEDESTGTVMLALRNVIEHHGWFASLYSDRASHFFYTPKANQAIDPDRLTQVGRALKEIGIQMIPSYSPQARGRSERGFRTWQGRLPQELRLRQIVSVHDANRFLSDHYIAQFNSKFAVAAKQKGTAFVPLHRRLDLDRIFSIQQERVVNHDNTVRWANVVLQIEPTRLRSTLAGCRVIVCEHLDQTLSIGWGPHTIGRYTISGEALDDSRVQSVARRGHQKKSARRGQGADFFVNKVTSAARCAP